MTTAEKITQLEQAVRECPRCNRLLGRLDVLKELANEEAGEDEEVPTPPEGGNDDT